MTLNQTRKGFAGRITHIHGDQAFKRKLMSLGIRAGQELRVLHRERNGVVIQSLGSRVALGINMAQKVELEALPAAEDLRDSEPASS